MSLQLLYDDPYRQAFSFELRDIKLPELCLGSSRSCYGPYYTENSEFNQNQLGTL